LDFYAKIKKSILRLERFPYAGHAPSELPTTYFLEIIAVKNRVIYEVSGDTVYIHIICDSRQDFGTKLARKPQRNLRP
jgi:plasmid stabilization system protein ParE